MLDDLVLPVAIVGAMPYVMTGVAKAGGFTMKDNERTRLWQGELSGWRQRAHWAHQNAFEAFPLFAVCAILAHLGHPGSVTAEGAAWAFVALRIVYSACYLANAGRARSLVWTACMAANVVLLLVAASVL